MQWPCGAPLDRFRSLLRKASRQVKPAAYMRNIADAFATPHFPNHSSLKHHTICTPALLNFATRVSLS
jgi:hypothetical protein